MLPYSGPCKRSHRPGRYDQYNSHETGNPNYYCFNDLGFRDGPGGQFNPDADITIYACGCSRTLGLGVQWGDAWPTRVARKFRRTNPDKTVSLLNMAQGGASNDYIARMSIAQCRERKPSALFINWTDMARAERCNGQTQYSIGPWSNSEYTDDFFLSYTDENGVMSLAKNAMLVQTYCQLNGIPYVMAGLNQMWSANTGNPMVEQWVGMVSAEHANPHPIGYTDVGGDKTHPGPKSHRDFADKMFRKWRQRQG